MGIPSLSTVGGVTLSPGYAGQLAEPAPPGGVVSCINENATAIDFGQVVVAGAAVAAGYTQNGKPQTADADKVIGVSMRSSQPIASTDGNNTVNYARYSTFDLAKRCTIFAIPCENVTARDAALVITAGSGSKIGGTTGGVAGTGRVAMAGVWETTTASGAIGKLRLDIP